MKFALVGSGSKGNASLIYTEQTLIQIDMGVPLKRIKEACQQIGRGVDDISCLFITHEHSDHISTIARYRGKLPIYASEKTLRKRKDLHILTIGETKQINDLSVTPFSTSHDAKNPIGFLLDDGKEKLGYVTDTGCLSNEALALLKDCTYYVFESNHDLKMLYASSRPISLKRRIHSEVGHLSNVDSANYMAELIGLHTKGIYLAHLSEECNTPELALSTYKKVLSSKGIDFSKYLIVPAKQYISVYGGDE